MIKRLLPLSWLCASMWGQEFYFFPDQTNDFLQTLTHDIRGATDSIRVLTPAFHSTPIQTLLLSRARSGIPVDLIVSDAQGNPAAMVQYDRIRLFVYRARALDGSLILIDDRRLCTLSLALDGGLLSQHNGWAVCSDDPSDLAAAGRYFSLTRQRSRPYLE